MRLIAIPFLALGFLSCVPPSFATEIICPDKTAAAQGSVVDEYALGKAYDEGYCGLAVEKTQAVLWYRKAAEQAHTLAQYELAETYFTGDGVPTDYPESKKWYLKAAESGHGLSQLRLGFLYAENHFKGLTTDYVEAEKWFLKAAEQNAGDAQFRLGNFYNNYKEPRDPDNGFIWLQKAAAGGHRVAMFDLARALFDGKGVARNPELGLFWMKKAADEDLLQAQVALAEMYAEGKEVHKDIPTALRWTLKIALKPTASVFQLNRAGDIFFEGWETVPKNYPTARKFYERAAAKGDVHALERLAEIYDNGLGVEKDALKAKEYREQSAR